MTAKAGSNGLKGSLGESCQAWYRDASAKTSRVPRLSHMDEPFQWVCRSCASWTGRPSAAQKVRKGKNGKTGKNGNDLKKEGRVKEVKSGELLACRNCGDTFTYT